MLSKTHSEPVYSPAPGVIPDLIGTPARSAPALSATPEFRTASSAARDPASRAFLAGGDDVNGHDWTIVAAGGEVLVRFASLRSHQEANADIGPARAPRSWFAHRSPVPGLVDLPALRDAVMARDRQDADRWSDDGGSFGSEGVSQ